MSLSESNSKKVNLGLWKSLRDYSGDPSIEEAKNNEFPETVTQDFNLNGMSKLSRRKFMALLSASAAFATTACTDYPDKGKIVPYSKKPEEVTLGIANYYATSYSDGSSILVKTREGRPIKINGNPDNPMSKGKVSNRVQAAVLDLYDPERIQFPQKKSESSLMLFREDYVKESWENIDKEIVKLLNKTVSEGKEIILVGNRSISPGLRNLVNDFKSKYSTADFFSIDQLTTGTRKAAWISCYPETPMMPVKWNEANIILSLEGDFLGVEGNPEEQIGMFSSRRDVNKPEAFNRLYVVESAMSITGINSDYRLKLSPEKQFDFVMSLLNELVIKKNVNNLFIETGFEFNLGPYSLERFSKENNLNISTLRHLVDDLIANQGKSYVYGGDVLSEDTHIAINLLNEVLSNFSLYDRNNPEAYLHTSCPPARITSLIDKLKSGKVGVLIHFDSNPVYHLPNDYGYEKAMEKVPVVISMAEARNESTLNSRYLLPINNPLESWGYYTVRKGLYNLQQPVIAPIYDSRQKEAVLLNWISDDSAQYTANIYLDYIKNIWETEIYPAMNLAIDFKTFWNKSLHDGFAFVKPEEVTVPAFNMGILNGIKSNAKNGSFAVILLPGFELHDGTQANNGWLQEIPHPVSKIVWDNYAAISTGTAKVLGVENDDMISVEVSGRKLEIPVFVQPGMADNVVAIELGYGRKRGGIIGSGVGFDAGVLISDKGGISQRLYINAKVKKIAGNYKLVSTQEHHYLDEPETREMHHDRGIIKDGTVEEYIKHPDFLKHGGHEFLYEEGTYELKTVNPKHEYKGIKWAMAIDMNKCTSCNKCIQSCTVENNVPVVGKEQTSKGREMHWIRLDRYYAGSLEEPTISTQPMLCQHCDDAPCENVCPVVATTHSPEGLNQMTYNRCVGTRYCANNCPFKVRRFNFFDFRDSLKDGFYYNDSVNMLHNPEVTVRSRGVMEKCSFCVQRIMEAKQDATNAGRSVKGSDVTTACQEACPAHAISFGDMNDPESDVSKLREHNLGYHVLETLNIKPNVTYIAKLRNTYSEEK